MTRRRPKRRLVTTPAMKRQALLLFSRQPELSTREVARRTRMPVATAARLRTKAGLASPYTPFQATAAAGQRASPPAAADNEGWVVLESGQVVARR